MKKLNKKYVYVPVLIIIVFILSVWVASLMPGLRGVTMSMGAGVPTLKGITTSLKAIPTLGAGENGALFDVILNVPEKSKALSPGDGLLISVELNNVGSQKTDTLLTYIVTREDGGDIVYIEHEHRAVETQDQFLKTIDLQELPFGEYKIYLHMLYANATATASGEFKINLY